MSSFLSSIKVFAHVCALALTTGCSSTVTVHRFISPEDAADAQHAKLLSIQRGQVRSKLREPTGIFGHDDDMYVLTTEGRIQLQQGDRIEIRGTYEVDESIPGGGRVDRGFHPALFTAGVVAVAAGAGAIICAGVIYNHAQHETGLLAGLGIINAMPCFFAGIVVVGGGVVATVESFRQPKVVDEDRARRR